MSHSYEGISKHFAEQERNLGKILHDLYESII